MGRDIWSIGEAPLFVIAGVVVVVFLLFSVYVQPAIDHAFKRRQYEFESIIDSFVRDVGGMRDFTTIIQRSVDILHDSLFLKSAFFILFSNENKRYELVYQRGRRGSPAAGEGLSRGTVVHTEPGGAARGQVYTDEKSFAEIRDDFLQFFSAGGVRICNSDLPRAQGAGTALPG